jgi:hypothetical protein
MLHFWEETQNLRPLLLQELNTTPQNNLLLLQELPPAVRQLMDTFSTLITNTEKELPFLMLPPSKLTLMQQLYQMKD